MTGGPFPSSWFPSHLRGGEEARMGEPLARLLEAGRAAWPGLGLSDEAFIRHVVSRLPAEGDRVAALGALHGEDLYLACACAQGLPRALSAFQERHGPQVDAALRGLKLPSGADEDLRQMLWEKLFVGQPGSPA